MADAKKVIKGLENCIATSDRLCPDDCPYYGICWDSSKGGELLYYSLMKDALELLKGQPEIVRCKDCIKRRTDKCALRQTGDQYLDLDSDDDWFCADGEVKRDV